MKIKWFSILLASITLVSCGSSIEPAKDVEKVYLAEFVTNGGSYVTPITGASIATSPVTTRESFSFEGWFDNESLAGMSVNFPYKLTSNMTFYAGWKELEQKHHVVFDSMGGSPVEDYYGDCILEAPISTREGYEFLGWYYEPDQIGRSLSFPLEINGDLTLYAKWKMEDFIPKGVNLVTAKIGAIKAESFWNFSYEANGLFVTTYVKDKYIYTRDSSLGYNDNVEMLISPLTSSKIGYIPNKTYRILICPDGRHLFQKAINEYTFSSYPSSVEVTAKEKTVSKDGYAGYEINCLIPYSLFDLDFESAKGQLCVCPNLRNRNSASFSTFETSDFCSYKDAWTYLNITDSGKAVKADIKADRAYLGDARFDVNNWKTFSNDYASIDVRAQSQEFIYTNESLETESRAIKIDKLINACFGDFDNVVLSYGFDEIIYGDSNDNIVKNILELAETIKAYQNEAKLYFVSICPILKYPGTLSKLKEVNASLKTALAELDFVFIDAYSSFVENSSIKSTMFATDGIHFSTAGYSSFKSSIDAALSA